MWKIITIVILSVIAVVFGVLFYLCNKKAKNNTSNDHYTSNVEEETLVNDTINGKNNNEKMNKIKKSDVICAAQLSACSTKLNIIKDLLD